VAGSTGEAVELQPHRGSGCGGRAPAQHGLHAGHELARLEGLGHVVVGAQLQPDHAVHHLAAGGEHDQGDVAGAADGAAQLEAVHLGQHDVEDGGVEPTLLPAGPDPRWVAAACSSVRSKRWK
jgi:hypothetical protein